MIQVNPTLNMKIYQLTFLFALSLLTACTPTYTYFTRDLYEQEKWSREDIMRIQFYLSKDIVLTRTITAAETSIAEGTIKVKNGERIEQVIIRSGTPGVLVLMPREDRFAISFEEDNEAYLMFGPNPKFGDRFALLAQEWDQDYGQVHYKDKIYYVDAASAYSSLMVDLRKEGESKYETRNVPGRKVKE
jgi:hypothetical protein